MRFSVLIACTVCTLSVIVISILNYDWLLLRIARLPPHRNEADGLLFHLDARRLPVTTLCVFRQGSCPDLFPCSGAEDWFGAPFVVEICDQAKLKPRNNALYVARFGLVVTVSKALREWRAKGMTLFNVGMLVMADELNTYDETARGTVFTDAVRPCDYVLRKYFFSSIKGAPADVDLVPLSDVACGPRTGVPTRCVSGIPPLLWLPLPPVSAKDMFLSQVAPASKRKCHACFIGREHMDRAKLVAAFRAFASVHRGEVNYYLDSNGSFSRFEFGLVMSQCAVSLIPIGSSPETHRMADAMRHGCILLLLYPQHRSYLEQFHFAKPPFFAVTNWEEAPGVIHALSPGESDAIQKETWLWYKELRRCHLAGSSLLIREIE